jgi:hypothetical protein
MYVPFTLEVRRLMLANENDSLVFIDKIFNNFLYISKGFTFIKFYPIRDDHSSLAFKSQRKNKLSIRYAMPKPIRHPTEPQRPTLKFY